MTGSASPVSGLRYVALGDSYTIGTSVPPADSWPSQLVDRLDGQLTLVANLGVNGYSSGDLIADELPRLTDLEPEFVSVQIGVNDVVRGVGLPTYSANVDRILDDLLARLPANRIVAVATPDYTVTPMGSAFGDPTEQSAGIYQFNQGLDRAASERGIAFVPGIFQLSQAAATDASLVASDGLHPSGVQYAIWVAAIAPVVEGLLSSP
jgi:lysophospholipase L1-like esterase